MVDGRHAGKEYHFQTEATIGRVEESDVVIIDPGISRLHAKVSGRRGVFLVEDMGSSNGTRLNGEIIDGPEVLRDGDYVTVGTVNIMFSNLELDKSGEATAQMRITEKQSMKLDFEPKKREQVDIELGRHLLTRPRVAILAVTLLFWILLPWFTRRFLELGLTILFTGGVFALLWFKFRWIIALMLEKSAVLAGSLIGIVLFSLIVGLVVPKKKKSLQKQEWSGWVIDYEEYKQQGYDTWAMGYVAKHQYYGDVNYRDKVVFKYYKSPRRQRITLEYSACGISEGEVVILLNKTKLAYIPEISDCRYNLKVQLPPGLLKDGDNLVVFDNLNNGPKGTDEWMITYVLFREEAIPNADPAQAADHYHLGMRFYEEREVDLRNRQKAVRHFKLSRDFLETLEKRPQIYRESIRMIRVIDKQLDKKFRDGTFEAQRLTNYGKYAQARAVLRRTAAYFMADKRDPRLLKLNEAFNRLSGR